MEPIERRPLQGVTNIIRFNWHFYVSALVLLSVFAFSAKHLPAPVHAAGSLLSVLVLSSLALSLLVSWYVYDRSELYSLCWLDDLGIRPGSRLVTIHAGFDETSALFLQKYPESPLSIFDFYDPARHTEISIERARKAYPASPGTRTIRTDVVPLEPRATDCIFLVLAAHEIRNRQERIFFFTQLRHALSKEGKIIVVEHSRDIYNFAAYTIGFLHFFSEKSWVRVFDNAGLRKLGKKKITPFISVFILDNHHGASS